jgi:hypothetical protein
VMFLNAPSGTPNDHNSGMQVYFTTNWWMLPGTTDKSLLFDKGQFVDEITDTPGIALQTMWAVKGTFSNDTTDSTLWPILVGTIGGEDVMGLPMHAEDGWDKFADFWGPLTFQSVINNFLMIMGVVMAIDFIKTKVQERVNASKEKKANQNKGNDLTPEQEAAVKVLADQIAEAARGVKVELAGRLGNNPNGDPKVQVPTQDTIEDAQAQAKAEAIQAAQDRIEAAKAKASEVAQDALEKFDAQLRDLAQYAELDPVRDAKACHDSANACVPEALKTGDFTLVSQNLSEGQGYINDFAQRMGDGLDQMQQDGVKTSSIAAEVLESKSKTAKDTIADAEDEIALLEE